MNFFHPILLIKNIMSCIDEFFSLMLHGMDTYRLRIFSAVAKRCSLAAAAKDVHLTPSAVSHCLKALESEIGCRLLDRVGKKVYLNQAGEQLLMEIRKPLAALDAAAEGMKRLGKWGQTRLRIGAASSVCQYILPSVLSGVKKSFPRAAVQVESGDAPEMVEMLQQNRIDLAFVLTPDHKTGLEVRPLFSDELLFTFAPSHPWARARVIPRNEIPTQPYILYQRTSVTAMLVDEYFRSEHMVPFRIMEIASIEAIKELVKLNLGVGVMVPWTARRELKEGTLRMRPLGTRPLKRHWAIICLAGRRMNLIEETFCQLCQTFVGKLRTGRFHLGDARAGTHEKHPR